MQKDFCLFILDQVPSLREYGNVSFHRSQRRLDQNIPEATNLSPNSPLEYRQKNQYFKSDTRTVVPILAIDIPD